MKFVTLFVRHGASKYQDSQAQMDSLFSRQLPGIERTTIVIDNALPGDFVEQCRNRCTLIGGDNSSWEFSAWNKGLDFLGERIWSYDLVHLATSAFHTLYVAYLDRFDIAMMQALLEKPVCVGHIDCYNQPIRILSFRSQHWLRTSFLFAPPAEIKMLRSLVSVTNPAAFFTNNAGQVFPLDAEISGNYQKYIVNWLTGSDIGQGSVWHSKLDLHGSLFRAKATAILNEHLLSIRLRAQGTRLLDATWLSTHLKTESADAIPWDRLWLNQLAERDRDKVIVPNAA